MDKIQHQSDVEDNLTERTQKLAGCRRRIGKATNFLVIILALLGIGIPTFFLLGLDELQSRRKYRVLVPLYASSQEYLDYMSRPDGHFPIKGFKRKVSADTLYALEAARSAWLRAFEDDYIRKDNFDFYYFPEGYDDASYKAAFEKALRTADDDDFEVVGAIGHITSTATRAYGPFYGAEQLPLLLPMATATNLTDYLRGTCSVPAVLRLPPTNDKQAELISKFLLNQGAFRVILAKDLSNPAYSNDLVEGFRAHFVTQPFESQRKETQQPRLPLFLVDHGQVLAVIPGGGETGAPITYFEIKNMKPDALVMVGMTDFSLETVAQARACDLTAPYTIFTDGAIDEDLLPRANRLISDRDSSDVKHNDVTLLAKRVPQNGTIYITFPLEAPLPEALNKSVFEGFHVLDDQLGVQRNLEMTHSLYVVDSAQIILQIIKDNIANKKLSWFRSARKVVAGHLNEWNNNKVTLGRFSSYEPDRKYNLDGSGNAVKLEYHLYRATLPGITEKSLTTFMDSRTRNEQIAYWGEVRWVHDKSCPTETAKH